MTDNNMESINTNIINNNGIETNNNFNNTYNDNNISN